MRHEGLRGLWRGLGPSLSMSIPSAGLYLTLFEYIRDLLSAESTPWVLSSPVAAMTAGSTARLLTASALLPLEVARTNLQAHPSSEIAVGGRNTLAILNGLWKTRGLSSWWTGMSATLWRDVPFSAIYWSSYASIANRLKEEEFFTPNGQDHDPTAPSFTTFFIAGFSSGIIAATATHPMDVLKTKIQTDGKAIYGGGLLRVFRHVWQQEGFSGLWTGYSARVAKVAPACGIMYGVYEYLKPILQGNT
mgnify:FL=1